MNNNQNDNMPRQWTLTNYDEYIHMQKTWFGASTIFMSVFFAIWVGAAIYMFGLMGNNFSRMDGAFGLIIPVVFGLATLGFAYANVANYFNKTDIFVSADLMEIKIGPMPWPGNKRLETKNIVEFYVKTVVSGSGNKRSVDYQIWYRREDGKRLKFLSGFSYPETAEFIERKLEDYLGL